MSFVSVLPFLTGLAVGGTLASLDNGHRGEAACCAVMAALLGLLWWAGGSA